MLVGFLHLVLALPFMALAAISTGFIQLIFTIPFIVLMCSGAYRITLPVGLKIIDLCSTSRAFRVGMCIFLAMCFAAVGVMQYIDFINETGPALSRFFPLSFLGSAIFLVLIFCKQRPIT